MQMCKKSTKQGKMLQKYSKESVLKLKYLNTVIKLNAL